MESTWVPLGRCSPKRDEIQLKLLYYANLRVISRMEEISSPEATRELIIHADNAHLHMTKLVENFLMISEMK
jgi:hypothetical protein